MRTKALLRHGHRLDKSLAGRELPLLGQEMPNYDGIVLSDSPIGYWKGYEASGSILDYSGNNRPLDTPQGTPTYRNVTVPGFLRGNPNHLAAGGSSGMIRTTAVPQNLNNITIECWVLPQICTSNGNYCFGNGEQGGIAALINANFTIQAYYPGVVFGASSALAMTVNKWNHVAIVQVANVGTIYINAVADANQSGAAMIAPLNNAGWVAGAARQCGFGYLAFYNSALSLAKIQTRYNAMKRLSWVPVA